MTGTEIFGYVLIGLSAVLLASHWQLWRDAAQRPMLRADVEYIRGQLQRRSVASALIGVIGAAMTLIDRVPHTPWSISAYLFGLLLGGAVILAVALADMRAARRRREVEHLDLVAQELQKAGAPRPESEPSGRAT